MRTWRQRNSERYREYNRDYQRKRYIERKLARIERQNKQQLENAKKLCAYNCGREAVGRILRVDLRTWKPVLVNYCGHC